MIEMIPQLNIDEHSALLIVDMQYDFLPNGALPVEKGDEIISGINELAKKFYNDGGKVVFTQDWHPLGHKSFASAYEGKNPGDPISTPGLGPILWPDHCIQNTFGAQIHEDMLIHLAIAIIRKGYNPLIDSYSAFCDNDQQSKTGLAGFLKELNITKVYICGLALDYCCFYSAMDAKQEGFDVFFLKDLTRGIDQPVNNVQSSLQTMQSHGIRIFPDFTGKI